MHHTDTALAFAAMVHADSSLRAAEVAGIVAMLEAAELYAVGDQPDLPAELQMRRMPSGRDGVLGPSEAFVLEAGAAMGMGTSAMKERISQASSVRMRHPRMWEMFIAGVLPSGRVGRPRSGSYTWDDFRVSTVGSLVGWLLPTACCSIRRSIRLRPRCLSPRSRRIWILGIRRGSYVGSAAQRPSPSSLDKPSVRIR